MGGGFHNDLVVTRTECSSPTRVDRLVVVPLDVGGFPVGDPDTLALSGAWPASPPNTTNANGIRELPDGSLVLNNSRVVGYGRSMRRP